MAPPPPVPDAARSGLQRFGARAWRALWVGGGVLALLLGVVGIFVPLLPTVPFLLLAALCFSRGCQRCERWLLAHPRLGPAVRDWRQHRALSMRAKQAAILTMAVGATVAWITLPDPLRWLPGVVCVGVGWWLWRLPTRRRDPP